MGAAFLPTKPVAGRFFCDFNLAVALPAALLVVSGFLVCEGACKLVVSGGVTRGRVARGAMWQRHRGAWRPNKAQAQKQPNPRVAPSTSSLTFLVNLAIRGPG